MKFRGSINKIFLDMISDQQYQKYVGTADVNPILIFLKKAFRNLSVSKDTANNYVDYVEYILTLFKLCIKDLGIILRIF